jgi:hypothetical protein
MRSEHSAIANANDSLTASTSSSSISMAFFKDNYETTNIQRLKETVNVAEDDHTMQM